MLAQSIIVHCAAHRLQLTLWRGDDVFVNTASSIMLLTANKQPIARPRSRSHPTRTPHSYIGTLVFEFTNKCINRVA